MLSYRHGFHAGNWADVHKHAALALLLAHLGRKEKPFCVIDAFAGDGAYDLAAREALKTGEFRWGIARIYDRSDGPEALAPYLARVRAYNDGGPLRRYPGSPALARAALRGRDRLILCEQHPAAHARLKVWAGADARIALHRRDGFLAMKGLLPPAIRRGLAVLDPSYEVKSDYDAAPRAVADGLGRWPTGIFALWYPILAEGRHEGLIAALADLPVAHVLQTEIGPVSPPPMGRDGGGLKGAGLIIVSPPWRFDRAMQAAGDWLAAALWPDAGGRHRLRRLKG